MQRLSVSEIQAIQRIVMPVNLPDENHWVLVHADLVDMKIEVLDSWAKTYEAGVKCPNATRTLLTKVLHIC